MGLDTFNTIASNSGNPDVNFVDTVSGLSEGGTGTYGDTTLYTTPLPHESFRVALWN